MRRLGVLFDAINNGDWGTALFVILGIVVFMVLVVLHEFGHFMAARKCGMKVPEFGIGLPPKACNLWKDKKGTQYTLNWIPLRGFCQIEGDDPTDKESFKNPNTLFTAPLWKRLIVIFAGITMNFLTARVIFTCIFWHGVQPLSVSQMAEEKGSTSYLMASSSFLKERGFLTGQIESGVLIQEVNEGGLGEQIGLKQNDVLLKFDDKDLDFSNFSSIMQSGDNNSHTLTIKRGDIEIETEEFDCDGFCTFGTIISENGNLQLSDIKFGLGGAMIAAFHEIGAERNLTMDALGILGKGLFSFNKGAMKDALNNLSGPVGAVKIGGLFYEMGGWGAYFAFAAIISLALAIFNVLPIPALDGGRAVGMILQAIFKIKPEKYFKYEGYVNMFFFYLILLLGIVIIVKDLVVFRGVNIPFVN